MDQIPPSGLRVGDAEREDALRALGEHMSAGRIDIDEYGERSAKITAARTAGDLTALFADLPAPKPGAPAPPALPVAPPPPQQPVAWAERPLGQRLFAALVPISALTGLSLFLFVVHAWPLLLLPVVVTVIGGALFGEDWRDNRGRGHGHRPFGPGQRRRHYNRGWH
ncbi:DUF1707 SHOCT-like domain-containing protein [Actinokineospora globicatena]|uniref:DUF1707 domain-containing protein n=1 Tax=Actinokineospora globicatena TaxID=103729 RepID=A0A9W6QUQ1_9PSEU|nr:DUF1707 domain-containing protein [Actinokineospora globicatena]GLW95398.1 hypothetical protein Aglo03_62140 [Actinokineospora globicatena]